LAREAGAFLVLSSPALSGSDSTYSRAICNQPEISSSRAIPAGSIGTKPAIRRPARSTHRGWRSRACCRDA
jgi:hypothetical protein